MSNVATNCNRKLPYGSAMRRKMNEKKPEKGEKLKT